MAQALERAGDHTTNLAEDLYSLIEGRSLRHMPKKESRELNFISSPRNSSFLTRNIPATFPP